MALQNYFVFGLNPKYLYLHLYTWEGDRFGREVMCPRLFVNILSQLPLFHCASVSVEPSPPGRNTKQTMAEGFKPGFTARSAGSREREKEAERIMNLDSVDLGMWAALSGLVPAGVSVCAVHACAPRREEERDLAVIQGPLKCPRSARISREAVSISVLNFVE